MGGIQFDPAEISSLVQQTARELRVVVGTNALWFASESDDPAECFNDLVRPEIWFCRCRENLSRMVVHNRQNPEWPIVKLIVKEFVRHKVHRPDIVHSAGLFKGTDRGLLVAALGCVPGSDSPSSL